MPAYGGQWRDPTAVMGRRIGAYLIDIVLAFIACVVVFVALAETIPLRSEEAASDYCDRRNTGPNFCVAVESDAYEVTDGEFGIVLLAGLAVVVLNQGVISGFAGASLGKAMVGLRVVRTDGRPAGLWRSLLRTLLLIVPDSSCLAIVGLATAFASAGHRRVGDMAADTVVVRREDARTPLVIPRLTAGAGAYGWPAPVAPPPGAWGTGAPPPGTWGPGPGAGPQPWGPTAPQPWGTSPGWPPPAPADAPPAWSSTPVPSTPAPAPDAAAPSWVVPQPASPPAGADAAPVTDGGWSQPAAASPPASSPTPVEPSVADVPAPAAAEQAAPIGDGIGAPLWDPGRGTYLQWDPDHSLWMAWDDDAKRWVPAD